MLYPYAHDNSGHYLKCVINMIESPDNGHTIGVLSVLDLTQFKINDQISMHLAHAIMILSLPVISTAIAISFFSQTAKRI